MVEYKQVHVGLFENQEQAAKAYDTKAKELLGAKAKLNFV
jgi:protein-disulfide isomerase